ncbi:MAG: hypothetical protein GX237_07995 [Clostridiales bacterium]|nr:hypothetical protein [Clostridiales bacterium]
MKLKYKKIILLTSLCIMGIGLLTLSISQSKPKAEDGINSDGQLAKVQDEKNNKEAFAMSALNLEPEVDVTLETTPTPSPTPIPTPTPIPVYPLEEVEGMDEFIDEYYIAKTAIDVDKLKTLYLNPSKVETREQLQKLVQYIEEYKNIKTHTKRGIDEGTYIVFAYHEIKFSSINTLAPGLSKFYVTKDSNGEFKIISDSDMTPIEEEYYNARNYDEDVQELISKTNENGEKAKEKDEDLMIFWSGLDELANQNSAGDNEDTEGEDTPEGEDNQEDPESQTDSEE